MLGSFTKGAPLSKADITETGTPFILYGELYTTYGEVTTSIARTTDKTADKEQYSQVGDVIIPTSGETPEEIATATCVMLPDVILAGDLNIYRNKDVDGRIISYIINHVINGDISRIAQGKSVVHIKADELSKLSINFPSPAEQQKLINFLSLIDRRIEKQRQLVEALKLYKRGVFLELYGKVKKTKIPFSDLYITASEGGTPSTSNPEYYQNGDIPFAKIDDLSSRYFTNAKTFITQKGLEKSSAWLIPENSLIFSNGATIGACSINKIPTATKQGILGIVPQKNISVSFLYHYMTSPIFMKKIKSVTTRGTMDCAYLKDINTINIEIPNLIEQKKIAQIMDGVYSFIEKQNDILAMLNLSKTALLQQLFI